MANATIPVSSCKIVKHPIGNYQGKPQILRLAITPQIELVPGLGGTLPENTVYCDRYGITWSECDSYIIGKAQAAINIGTIGLDSSDPDFENIVSVDGSTTVNTQLTNEATRPYFGERYFMDLNQQYNRYCLVPGAATIDMGFDSFQPLTANSEYDGLYPFEMPLFWDFEPTNVIPSQVLSYESQQVSKLNIKVTLNTRWAGGTQGRYYAIPKINTVFDILDMRYYGTPNQGFSWTRYIFSIQRGLPIE